MQGNLSWGPISSTAHVATLTYIVGKVLPTNFYDSNNSNPTFLLQISSQSHESPLVGLKWYNPATGYQRRLKWYSPHTLSLYMPGCQLRSACFFVCGFICAPNVACFGIDSWKKSTLLSPNLFFVRLASQLFFRGCLRIDRNLPDFCHLLKCVFLSTNEVN